MSPSQTVVLAQAAPGGLEQMLPLVMILVVFYFLLVRPQQKRAREHRDLVEALKKNDQVVTTGGLHGRVVDLTESVVSLEIAPNVIVRHDRSQIGAVAGARDAGASKTAKAQKKGGS
jgi:preprotein translocase subunit YajC